MHFSAISFALGKFAENVSKKLINSFNQSLVHDHSRTTTELETKQKHDS